METRIMARVLGFCTLLLGATVQADDGRWRGHELDGAGSWRLGNERIRGGYSIYHRGGGGWYRVPGAAIDVAEGWVIGTQREDGGFAIYRWNGYGWDQAPGGAVRIGGSYRQPWVVNNRGQRFTWDGYDWRPAYGYSNRRSGFESTRRPRHEAPRERRGIGSLRHRDQRSHGFERRHNTERGRRSGDW